MPTGNGAFVLHKTIEAKLGNYRVQGYNPYLTMVPPFLTLMGCTLKPLAVHTAPDHAIFSVRKTIPLVLTFHNYVLDPWMRSYSSFLQKIHYATDLRLWSKLAVRKARKIVAVSQFTASLAQRDLNIRDPIRTIYNGIDTASFVPPHSRTPKNQLSVFFSGNPTRRKGFQWLPGIAEGLNKGIKIFYTLGLRKHRAPCDNERMQHIGHVPHRVMNRIYNRMDILLMPTVREGFGLSVAEAMACGLPVVASDCSSLPELIDHGKGGFLCPVGDMAAFAEKINVLADSPKLRKEMGEYNRAKVEKMFTLERMVAEYKALFEEVLG